MRRDSSLSVWHDDDRHIRSGIITWMRYNAMWKNSNNFIIWWQIRRNPIDVASLLISFCKDVYYVDCGHTSASQATLIVFFFLLRAYSTFNTQHANVSIGQMLDNIFMCRGILSSPSYSIPSRIVRSAYFRRHNRHRCRASNAPK